MNHIKGTWQICIRKYFHFPGKIHVHQRVENKSWDDLETCHALESLRAGDSRIFLQWKDKLLHFMSSIANKKNSSL